MAKYVDGYYVILSVPQAVGIYDGIKAAEAALAACNFRNTRGPVKFEGPFASFDEAARWAWAVVSPSGVAKPTDERPIWVVINGTCPGFYRTAQEADAQASGVPGNLKKRQDGFFMALAYWIFKVAPPCPSM